MDPARLTRHLYIGFAAVAFSTAGCGLDRDSIVLAATTSTYDSGLIERLVSEFRLDHPEVRVRTVIAGSGQALELGRRGDVDLLLVHAPEAEARFVEEGYSAERIPVMYNDFLIVGPPEDPAGIAGAGSPARALARIAATESSFISRGDSSGTHYRELALWAGAGVAPKGAWYLESGQGQATSLQVASERAAYTLTDRATFTVLQQLLELEPLVEGHPTLLNVYSLLQPTAAARPAQAAVFVRWLTSEVGERAIADFHYRGSDVPLFLPLISEEAAPPSDPAEVEADSVPPPDSVRGPTT